MARVGQALSWCAFRPPCRYVLHVTRRGASSYDILMPIMLFILVRVWLYAYIGLASEPGLVDVEQGGSIQLYNRRSLFCGRTLRHACLDGTPPDDGGDLMVKLAAWTAAWCLSNEADPQGPCSVKSKMRVGDGPSDMRSAVRNGAGDPSPRWTNCRRKGAPARLRSSQPGRGPCCRYHHYRRVVWVRKGGMQRCVRCRVARRD